MRLITFIISILLVLTLFAAASSQQIKTFDVKSWSGYLETSSFSDKLKKNWFSSRNPLQDNEYGFTEGIFLRLNGSIYHPRFWSWTGKGKYTFKQRFLSNETIANNRNIFEGLQEYHLTSSILKEHPTSLGFFISRGFSDVDGDFIEAINVKNNNIGVNISSLKGGIKQLLNFRRSHYISEGLVAIDELKKTVAYDANIRGKRLYTNIRYEYNDNDFITSKKTYITHSARLINNLKIDNTGKNILTGQFSYFHQKNTVTNRYYEGSISSSININDNLFNKMSYSHRNNKIDSIGSLANTGDITFIHHLYRSLISTASFSTYKTEFSDGEEIDINPTLNLDYRKTTFFGSLKLRYDFGYRKHKVDMMSRQSNRETHVYSSGIPITLNSTNIDTSTIVITDAANQQSTPYRELIDYIIEISGSLIRIIIPITSSIQDGDSILVTYISSNDNYYKYDEVTNIYGFSMGFHQTIILNASHSDFNRSLLDGFSSVDLNDIDVDRVDLNIRLQKFTWQGSYYNVKTTRNPIKRRSLSARYYYTLSNKINLILNGSFIVSDFPDVQERSEHTNFAVSVWYYPRRNLSVKSRFVNQKIVGRSDDGYNWIFKNTARYNLQMLLIELSFNIYSRKVDIVGTEDRTIAKINIRRTF